MSIFFSLFVAIVVISVLFAIIVVHEWGHYKTAKLFGIRVDEFGFGYPPKIKTLFKRGETVFTLNALPFGGFVKIYGEEAIEGGDTSRALFTKPKWQQAIVMVAGVVMNIVLAWVIFVFLFTTQSKAIQGHLDSQYISDVHVSVKAVTADSVADRAGLLPNDIIQTVTDTLGAVHTVIDTDDFVNFIHNTQGKTSTIGIVRDGVHIDKKITPIKKADSESYTIGIALDETSHIHIPFFTAIKYSLTTTYGMLADIFRGIYQLFASLFGVHSASHAQVSGPIGIISVIKDAMAYGVDYVLYLTALISLNLAVLNILPIPALDGGRLLFILIEKIKGKSINIQTATIIHSVSFFILVGLMLLVTFFDVVKLFR